MLMLSLSEVLALNKLYFPLEVIVRLGGSTGETALAKICGVSEKTARRWLVELARLGYLERQNCHNGYVLTRRIQAANRQEAPAFREAVPESQENVPHIREKTPEYAEIVPETREEAPESLPTTADGSGFNPLKPGTVESENRYRSPAFQQKVLGIQEDVPGIRQKVPGSTSTTTTSTSLINHKNKSALKAVVVDPEDAEVFPDSGEKIPTQANTAAATPAESSPPSREALKALQSCGIGEPKRSELARLPFMDREFIQRWKAELHWRGKLTAPLLIHCLETGEPPPEPAHLTELEPEDESLSRITAVFDKLIESYTPHPLFGNLEPRR